MSHVKHDLRLSRLTLRYPKQSPEVVYSENPGSVSSREQMNIIKCSWKELSIISLPTNDNITVRDLDQFYSHSSLSLWIALPERAEISRCCCAYALSLASFCCNCRHRRQPASSPDGETFTQNCEKVMDRG